MTLLPYTIQISVYSDQLFVSENVICCPDISQFITYKYQLDAMKSLSDVIQNLQ